MRRHPGRRPEVPRWLRGGLVLLALLALATPAAVPGGRPAASGQRVVFAVIGDSGSGKPAQYAVAARMRKEWERRPFPFVLMLGDNLYGQFKGAESFRERFEKPYAALLGQGVTFRAVLGNHGSADDEARYPAFGMGGRRYYTFTEGDGLAQFFAIDSDRLDETPSDTAQVSWLESALKASTARWKVAFFHQPIYNAGRTHGPNLKLRAVLEPLFVKYGVRLVLSGHEHVYQRLEPRGGVAYFIEGASGKVKPDSIDRADGQLRSGNDAVCSFLVFELTPADAAFRVISAAGDVIDSGSLPLAPEPR